MLKLEDVNAILVEIQKLLVDSGTRSFDKRIEQETRKFGSRDAVRVLEEDTREANPLMSANDQTKMAPEELETRFLGSLELEQDRYSARDCN